MKINGIWYMLLRNVQFFALALWFPFSACIDSSFKNEGESAVDYGCTEHEADVLHIFKERISSSYYRLPAPLKFEVSPSKLKQPQELHDQLIQTLEVGVSNGIISKEEFIGNGRFKTYGDRYLMYVLELGNEKQPYYNRPFFMVLDPRKANTDPWNHFYAVLFDPTRLPDGPKTRHEIMGGEAERSPMLWGMYRQKLESSGLQTSLPVLFTANNPVEESLIFNYFACELKQAKLDHDFTAYSTGSIEMSPLKNSNTIKIAAHFGPKGGVSEYEVIATYDKKQAKLSTLSFSIIPIDSSANAYNDKMRKRWGNVYAIDSLKN
jgi:hypothetical protein